MLVLESNFAHFKEFVNSNLDLGSNKKLEYREEPKNELEKQIPSSNITSSKTMLKVEA